MKYDPNGLVTRWSGCARRGTLPNVGYALIGLAAIAFVLYRFVG
jgi:hypothetical protein